MNDSTPQFNFAYLEPFHNPFSGKLIEQDCCALCNAVLPLPGEYPMLVVRDEPDAKLYDCTGDTENTDENGQPTVIQTGIRIERPVCPHHATERR